MSPPSQPSFGDRVRAVADRHGLALTSDGPPRPHVTGRAADLGFGPAPRGLWQTAASRLSDPTANARAAADYLRERYGRPGSSFAHALGMVPSVERVLALNPDTSEEDTMAPPNPYRERLERNDGMTARFVSAREPAPGDFDVDTLNLLLRDRYRAGEASGRDEHERAVLRASANAHDEGFHVGESHERDRIHRAFDGRMHAMHDLASAIAAPDAAYGEDDVFRVLRLLGATVGQVIAEWNGDGAVRERLSPGSPDVMVNVDPPRADESPDAYEVRRNLDALEQFLRMRLPDRVEPIDHDDPDFVVEVAVHTGMTAEQVEAKVRDALQQRRAQQERGGEA